MRRGLIPIGILIVCLTGGAAGAQPGAGMMVMSNRTVKLPPVPPAPAEAIRAMRAYLSMSAADREKALAGKSPEQRRFLEAKFNEYDSLQPEERETRLAALQLRYYLSPLLKLAATNRAPMLATIPMTERPMIEERLGLWDKLTPEERVEFLKYEDAVRSFAQSTSPILSTGGYSPNERARLEQNLEAWNELPEPKRQQIHQQFQQFFTLDSNRMARTASALGDSERAALQKIMVMPPPLRDRCLTGLEKFTRLTAQEQADFLKAAERWQRLNDQQRQQWSQISQQLPPGFPLPPTFKGPPMPPRMKSTLRTSATLPALVSTNR